MKKVTLEITKTEKRLIAEALKYWTKKKKTDGMKIADENLAKYVLADVKLLEGLLKKINE